MEIEVAMAVAVADDDELESVDSFRLVDDPGISKLLSFIELLSGMIGTRTAVGAGWLPMLTRDPS